LRRLRKIGENATEEEEKPSNLQKTVSKHLLKVVLVFFKFLSEIHKKQIFKQSNLHQ
jgi:hypothetical protein